MYLIAISIHLTRESANISLKHRFHKYHKVIKTEVKDCVLSNKIIPRLSIIVSIKDMEDYVGKVL